jgi:hypothetical protein
MDNFYRPTVVYIYDLDEKKNASMIDVVKDRKEKGFDLEKDPRSFSKFKFEEHSISSIGKYNYLVDDAEYVFPSQGKVICMKEEITPVMGTGKAVKALTKKDGSDFYPFFYILETGEYRTFLETFSYIPWYNNENSSYLLDLMAEVAKSHKGPSFNYIEPEEGSYFVTLSFFPKEDDEYPVVLAYKSGLGRTYITGKEIRRTTLYYYYKNRDWDNNGYWRDWNCYKDENISTNHIRGIYEYAPKFLGDDYSTTPVQYRYNNTVEEFKNAFEEAFKEMSKLELKPEIVKPIEGMLKHIKLLSKDKITIPEFEELSDYDHLYNIVREIEKKVDTSCEVRPFITDSIAREGAEKFVTVYKNGYRFNAYVPGFEIDIKSVLKDSDEISNFGLCSKENFYAVINGKKVSLSQVGNLYFRICKEQKISTEDLYKGRFYYVEIDEVKSIGKVYYRVRPFLDENSDEPWSEKDPRG